MVSPYAFLSRILHIGGGSILLAHSWSPFWVDSPIRVAHRFLVPGIALVMLLSGLYNISRAKPSSFASGSRLYRILTYSKILLLFVFTPTFESFAGKYGVALGGVLALFLGTNARFLRESQTLK
jgi:hypothetical protein